MLFFSYFHIYTLAIHFHLFVLIITPSYYTIPFFRPTKEDAAMMLMAMVAITTTRTETAIIIPTRNRKDRRCDAGTEGLTTKVRLFVFLTSTTMGT